MGKAAISSSTATRLRFGLAVAVVVTFLGPRAFAETTPPATSASTAKAKPAAEKPEAKVGAEKQEAKPAAAKQDVKAAGAPKAESVSPVKEKDKEKAKDNATAPASTEAAGAADGSADEKAKAKPKAKTRAKTNGAKPPAERIGEGPSPASPSPLTMGGLRDEMRREHEGTSLDPATPARSKVEQMLAEVTKARLSLHEDTARLEGMLTQDAEGPEQGQASAGQGAAQEGSKPAAKNPLDILAKALRGIKPEQAAPIVSRLEKRLAATVLQRMPPVDAGKILGAMKADTAAELATQIAMRTPSREVRR